MIFQSSKLECLLKKIRMVGVDHLRVKDVIYKSTQIDPIAVVVDVYVSPTGAYFVHRAELSKLTPTGRLTKETWKVYIDSLFDGVVFGDCYVERCI